MAAGGTLAIGGALMAPVPLRYAPAESEPYKIGSTQPLSGCAAAALLMTRPANLWLALLFGLVAAVVAYFSTRLCDIYFAITTLIFSQIFYVIIFTSTAWTGGENGLTFDQPALAIPGLFSLEFTPQVLYWFVLAVVAGSYLLRRRITQSPFA